MNDLHNFFTRYLDLSPLNTALLGIIFFLAKQRYDDQVEMLTHVLKRSERVERSLINAGIELLEME